MNTQAPQVLPVSPDAPDRMVESLAVGFGEMDERGESGESEMGFHECLSALVDGELVGTDLDRLLADRSADHQALRGSWAGYQLIGDVLRERQALPADPVWVASVMAAVRSGDVPVAEPASQPVESIRHARGQAANDSVFRWKLVAGLASLASVLLVAWQVNLDAAPVGGQLAQAPQMTRPAAPLAAAPATNEVVVVGDMGPVIRDARLEEMVAAHRRLGGMSALQMPAGFLRNATFESAPR